jgi:hypothetical protein
VEAFARNHRLPIEWAEKGVRKEDHVLPWQRRMVGNDAYGVWECPDLCVSRAVSHRFEPSAR